MFKSLFNKEPRVIPEEEPAQSIIRAMRERPDSFTSRIEDSHYRPIAMTETRLEMCDYTYKLSDQRLGIHYVLSCKKSVETHYETRESKTAQTLKPVKVVRPKNLAMEFSTEDSELIYEAFKELHEYLKEKERQVSQQRAETFRQKRERELQERKGKLYRMYYGSDRQ